jgi:gamma-glutamylcyclotransferase (GGCT)/AIG2-like uncharacterized protein YtfP
MTRFYLAYGANLNRAEMAFRCPAAVPVEAVELAGWQLEFCQHATIHQRPHGLLQAGVWAITDACEDRLDRFEGFPAYYRKQLITVLGEPTMVYLMNNAVPQTPTAGYLKCLAQGYEDWGLELDLLWQAYDRAEERERDLYDDDPRAYEADYLDTGLDDVESGHDVHRLRDTQHAYYGA